VDGSKLLLHEQSLLLLYQRQRLLRALLLLLLLLLLIMLLLRVRPGVRLRRVGALCIQLLLLQRDRRARIYPDAGVSNIDGARTSADNSVGTDGRAQQH
jgi:hypothetical protein